MGIIGFQNSCHHLVEDFRRKWIEEIAPVDIHRNAVFFCSYQQEV